jgi:hypothetical protein
MLEDAVIMRNVGGKTMSDGKVKLKLEWSWELLVFALMWLFLGFILGGVVFGGIWG